MGDDHLLPSDADEAALDEAEYLGEIGHWIAAPMKDVGDLDQFHEVCHRAQQVIGTLRVELAEARELIAAINHTLSVHGHIDHEWRGR